MDLWIFHQGKEDIAELLISKGANVNGMDKDAITPLMYAVKSTNEGRYETAKLLISHGANVNSSDSSGWTPLMYASHGKENEDMIKLLVAKGANVNARTGDLSALREAKERGDTAVVEILEKAGAR